MPIKEGLRATNGILMKTFMDQSQIFNIMENLLVVDGQLHSMVNQRATTQGLVQSELIEDCQAMEYL